MAAFTQCSTLLPSADAMGEIITNCTFRVANGRPGIISDRLEFSELERHAAFFANGLAVLEDLQVGRELLHRYLSALLSESVLCKFVACLANQGLKYRTINTYLSGYAICRLGPISKIHSMGCTCSNLNTQQGY